MANIAERFLKKSKVKGIKLHHVILLLIAALLIGFVWFFKASAPVSSDKKEQRFLIVRGSGASLVGTNLEKQGLIKSHLAFKIYVQMTGKSARILAGEYLISPNLSLIQVVDLLLKGPQEVWVTIPEGLRREEIALKMANGLGLEGNAKDKFVTEFLTKSQNLEGYLFPDTYLFPRDASASAAVSLMRSTFNQRIDFKVDNEVIILASILERETLNNGNERPIVAGILLKRLNAGWALQADATVQYAIAPSRCAVPTATCDWWPRPLTESDLEVNSAYNTYKNTGLPPTPISNPGLISIQAVVNPQDSPYWYYLHDSSGEIHYAATLVEQSANIQKYLR